MVIEIIKIDIMVNSVHPGNNVHNKRNGEQIETIDKSAYPSKNACKHNNARQEGSNANQRINFP